MGRRKAIKTFQVPTHELYDYVEIDGTSYKVTAVEVRADRISYELTTIKDGRFTGQWISQPDLEAFEKHEKHTITLGGA